MNRVELLCEKDRQMIEEFSVRSITTLKKHPPLRLFFSIFQRFFEENVRKEVQKDRLVIEGSGAVFETGRTKGEVDLGAIFEAGQRIDGVFLKNLSLQSVTIEIPYDEIAEIRKRRMGSLRDAVFELLANWEESMTFASVVKRTYAETRFARLIADILKLHNLETRILGRSITFRRPLNSLKELFAARLFAAMDEASEALSAEYTRKIYSGEGLPCVGRT